MAVSVLRNISKIRIVLTQRIPRISIIQQIYPAINKSFLTRRTMSSNRLTTEKSPYLLQHATNPVNWYPWGEEAIEASRSQNKLIFLSVGYSTCHWCHVMERESFENPEVADIMNKHYINVKVDREERPDVDRVYMSFVQASTGGGGWPMSVFLTPSLKPIFGGTYFPPEDLMYGRPGFKSILLNIAKQWESKRDELSESGDKIIEALSDAGKVASLEDNIMTQVDELTKICFLQFQRSYDEEMGGFSRAPKFPQPVNLNYLFNYHAIGKEDGFMKESLEMCLNTLENMARGGIHDHVSKGFARYSTDPAWHVPHFEKMLYDQGQLAVAYSRAFQITKDPKFSDVVTDIIEYVTRDLKHPQGGFYSGEDADSLPTHDSEKKQEGAFCVWSYDELGQLLTGKDLDIFSEYFTVRQDGNVSTRSDPHGELAGRNVLTNVGIDNEEIKSKFQLSDEELVVVIERCKAVLFEARGKRPRPHLDDKIITAWNGLMISGLCQAGSSLGKAEYIIQATKTATFIREHLFNESENELLRSIYNGGNGTLAQLASPIKGFLDDYAFLIRGLIDLYESGFDPKWLEWAMDLQEKQNSLFWDVESKAYFTTQEGDASIVMRLKEDQDGAEPSGNSVSCHNLIRLAALLDRADYREKAEQIFSAFGQTLLKFPVALPEMASALLIHQKTLVQICIAGDSVSANELIEAANSIHLPNKVIIRVDGNQESILYKKLKILHDMPASETKAYVCHNFTCSAPVTSKADLIKLLKSL